MKKTIIILLILFSACAVKAQTNSSPKIHLWAEEGQGDYTIQNELWGKLGDSRIFNKLGTYGYSYKWDGVKEGDYIVLILHSYMPNTPGNTTTLTFCQYQIINGMNKLIYTSNSVTTNISDQHIYQSVDACYKYILDWHDEYMK